MNNIVRMGTALDPARSYSASDCSGVVLSSETEIRQLREAARRLTHHQIDPMQDPEFFLASLSVGWRPRVVTINSGCEVVGIMYATERLIAGVPCGVVFADGGLCSPLLGSARNRQVLFRVAVETLLAHPRIRCVWLVVPQDSEDLDAVRQVASPAGLDVQYSNVPLDDTTLWKNHAHLALPGTFEEFLGGLGYTTRHNFRYYRRRFEKAGHCLVEHLSMEELHSAVTFLWRRTKHYDETVRDRLETELNMVAATDRPLAMALKHHSGEWLSVLAGWYRPRGAVLLFQCNDDQDFGHYSLSLVLRAYCIEHLIRQNLEELIIWWDTGPPLSRYATYVPVMMVRLDGSTLWWRAARKVVVRVGPRLPKRWAEAARWLA